MFNCMIILDWLIPLPLDRRSQAMDTKKATPPAAVSKGAAPPAAAPAAAAPKAANPTTSVFSLTPIDDGGPFDKWLAAQLAASPADPKDTDDFKYITFTERPPFTALHKSLMSKVLTPEMWDKYKDVKSSMGYTLSNAILPGVARPHLGVGITCGDEECFTLFQELIYPVVKGWHKFDPETQVRAVMRARAIHGHMRRKCVIVWLGTVVGAHATQCSD